MIHSVVAGYHLQDETFYGDETVNKVLKDGTVVPASIYESSVELDPGDASVFLFPSQKN